MLKDSTDPQEKQKYIVLIVIGLLYSVGIAYTFAVLLPTQRYTDDLYPRLYASQQLLAEGRSLYADANAAELVPIVGWPKADQLRFYYPAYVLLFTLPLSLIPYEAARMVWTMAGLWSIWLGTVWVARALKPALSVNQLTLLLVLLTTSVPALQHTLNAQFNWLDLLGLTLIILAVRREKYFLAGLAAGLLLFKPQTTLLPLAFLLIWTAFERRRWFFWIGLTAASLFLLGLAELFEPGWLVPFLQQLSRYEPIESVVDSLWNPYQLVSGLLVLAALWFSFKFRRLSAHHYLFNSLLALTICLNYVVVPFYGMLHIVLLGLVLVLLVNGFLVQAAPTASAAATWLWWTANALFVIGLLAFGLTIALAGATGLQITIAEMIYKTLLPLLLALAALLQIFGWPSGNVVHSSAAAAGRLQASE